jgi:hypothetical protein
MAVTSYRCLELCKYFQASSSLVISSSIHNGMFFVSVYGTPTSRQNREQNHLTKMAAKHYVLSLSQRIKNRHTKGKINHANLLNSRKQDDPHREGSLSKVRFIVITVPSNRSTLAPTAQTIDRFRMRRAL